MLPPYACGYLGDQLYWVTADTTLTRAKTLTTDYRLTVYPNEASIAKAPPPRNAPMRKAFPMPTKPDQPKVCGVIVGETQFHILTNKNTACEIPFVSQLLDVAFSPNGSMVLILTTHSLYLFKITIPSEEPVKVDNPKCWPVASSAQPLIHGCVTFPDSDDDDPPMIFYVGTNQYLWTYTTTDSFFKEVTTTQLETRNYMMSEPSQRQDVEYEAGDGYHITQIKSVHHNLVICATNGTSSFITIHDLDTFKWHLLEINNNKPSPGAMTLQTGSVQSDIICMQFSQNGEALYFLDAYSTLYQWQFKKDKTINFLTVTDSESNISVPITHTYIAGTIVMKYLLFKGLLMKTSTTDSADRYVMLDYYLKDAEEEMAEEEEGAKRVHLE